MRHLKCSKKFNKELEKENEEMRKFLLKEDCKLVDNKLKELVKDQKDIPAEYAEILKDNFSKLL